MHNQLMIHYLQSSIPEPVQSDRSSHARANSFVNVNDPRQFNIIQCKLKYFDCLLKSIKEKTMRILNSWLQIRLKIRSNKCESQCELCSMTLTFLLILVSPYQMFVNFMLKEIAHSLLLCIF